MPSPAVANAIAAAQRGQVIAAAQALEAAAAGGDGEAALTLANWRMAGDPVRRDLALARQFFGRASELGVAEAEPVYIAMLANGAGGCARQWPEALERLRQRARRDGAARSERDVLENMDLDDDGNPLSIPEMQSLHSAPAIRKLESFLSIAECRYLVRLAKPLLQPAVVFDPRTGQMTRHPVRSAESVGFPFVSEGPALHAINRRIAAVTGTCYEQGEPAQILSYLPGQEYRLHSDAIANEPNQRTATFLVCLHDDFEGGETVFPRLDLAWRGKAGDALHFCNVDDAGRPEPLAWHAGNPVTRGQKVILSKWIRARPLDLSGPPGRPL
ncbi:prolyl hydroxylase family protein [Tsuneonella sp. HG249]